ncbi:hypothetical protein Q5M49_04935 [Acinetobacter nosocomialis]|jgi:hypothetical protein|uniref:Lipoprotein n=2 Tax=Acinetobacter nosocomialis TaxID=106654 RepID=A0A8B4N3Z6_ACINO|nr:MULTISPECIES: hypothetical protein [Acinetobacter]KCY47917.1 hypothetical protein J715_3181 [Acinetobacter baumannii 1571545]KCZ33302.1 hypothetical protein J812_1316 [Acinetobacter baumannii 25977_9]SSQ43052.1 Uncharacterised protein [Acinetobacter baumannii]AJB47721.1 hypothetical protein RR32_06225 [Acinetobacter nosocomialis]EKU6035279.1 hypothetical protein [Acinetobacter nosocomialis]
MNKIIVLSLLGFTTFSLTACGGCPIIAGCNGTDNSPYYMTTVSNQIRGIPIPPQTKLTYQSQNFRQKFEQTHALKEKNLSGIALPENTAIIWGGMPVDMFIQFSNPEMKGFSVYPARGFKTELSNEFLHLWKSCESDLDINLKNPNDWSFNPENMEITGCGINQKRSKYTEDSFRQDEADAFLIKINQALHKLPKQQDYPVIYRTNK